MPKQVKKLDFPSYADVETPNNFKDLIIIILGAK